MILLASPPFAPPTFEGLPPCHTSAGDLISSARNGVLLLCMMMKLSYRCG
jgi:hypothetical protein